MKVRDSFEEALQKHNEKATYSTYSALANLAEKNPEILGLKKSRVAILRNYTIEPFVPIFSGELCLSGIAPEFYISDFDTIADNIFDPESELYKFKPEYVIISQWHETLSPLLFKNFTSSTPEQVENEVSRLIAFHKKVFECLTERLNCPVLINNFVLPDFTTLGILDVQAEQYQTYTLMNLNLELSKLSRQFSGVYWINHLGLFNRLGFQNCFDNKYWNFARCPFHKNVLIPLAQEYGKFFKAFLGKSKKCLVLDCDNTLWGGIVGEDGLTGIKLGTSHPGQIYNEFQKEILNLYHKGVILALCSKNNENDVFEVLDQHPDMALKKEHFATWQINWNDKATNLKQIATDLNIGLDSLVFLDDNPFECNLVKSKLPEVEVVTLGQDPLSFREKLLAPGYFDTLAFSVEDKKRNGMYVSDAKRKHIEANADSLEEYLASLKIVATVGEISSAELPRVSQLTQKTNQFNLTTKRYSEADISRFMKDKNCEVYFLHLKDLVSDLGIIGVGIINYLDKKAVIDSFLLSCRALGRGAEKALLGAVINRAKMRGMNEVIGEFYPTTKNAQVSNLYEKNGFTAIERKSSGSKWSFNLNDDTIFWKDLYPSWIELEANKNFNIIFE